VFSLAACSETKSKEKKPEKPHPIAGLVIEPAQKNGVFYQLDNLAAAIKAGKREQKRVLIYFTGWFDVNSRKMEDRILIDKEIQALLAENYLCFSAYVDDKQKIPGSDMSIGEKNAKLEMEHFKSPYQPHFYILDENGKVVADLGYVASTSEFLDFLEKGLK
jgi:thioredoxin-related protein